MFASVFFFLPFFLFSFPFFFPSFLFCRSAFPFSVFLSFFAFSSLSLSSLSFAFPSFFQITAGSLLFASGFFLFCFSLSFFRLFCFAGLPFLSPSFYLFSLFPLFPFLLFLLLFPSFFQITADSLSFASGFFLFCFFLPFSVFLFCRSAFPFSVFLSFFAFPLFPFL